jgi:hypothetical protein
VVGADLEGLVSPHYQSCLAVLFVPQQSNVTSSSLFPLSAVAVELEQFGSHLECLLFGFFVGLGFDFLG